MTRTPHRQILTARALRLCLGGIIAAGSPGLSLSADEPQRLDKLEQENVDLKSRLEQLEQLVRKEGLLPAEPSQSKVVTALSKISISGFVQASYFYNMQDPADGINDGYLWNTVNNSFSLNKFKLTIASAPVEASGDSWGAGFRASMIWGEDAPVVDTGSSLMGFEGLREAYVELNAPIGTGLNIKAGQLISLLNYESGDGGAVNANFSQGFQWFYTGNGPAAGLQVGYTVTEWLDIKARVQNGMYVGPVDNNSDKTFMGNLAFKPTKDLWFTLIGFTGDETIGETPPQGLSGGSVLAGYNFIPKLTTAIEFDFFHFDPDHAPSANLWSIGGWIGYDFSPKVTLGFRGEFLNAPDGVGIVGINLPGRPNSAIMSTDPDGNIGSLTLTLTYMPVPGLRIQPEVRYDYTSYQGGFDGEESRWILGAGVSYLF
ncbi:MAG TPA: outer membrane beta-barrel protein [Verrucomicrobiota bacterium]|nr:hypothetical protein [Verrucomicrobiales bacterium]HRI16059.1 outer membrane beta-barrel protein [Verrucomicrobiota bacterium]